MNKSKLKYYVIAFSIIVTVSIIITLKIEDSQVIVTDEEIRKIKSISIQIKYNGLGENIIAEKGDYRDLIISLRSGYLRIKNSNQNGYNIAWSPIGKMIINDESADWFTNKNDKMLNKYYKNIDQ